MDFSKIYDILKDVDGKHGIYFKNLKTCETFSINENIKFLAASVIKIPLVAFVFELVKKGELSLTKEIYIKDENYVAGTGIIKLLKKKSFSIEELCHLAIAISDNCATNELIDLVGGCDRVNEYLKKLGYLSVILNRKMLDITAIKEGKDNYISLFEISDILERILKGTLVSEKYDKLLLKFLKNQIYLNKLPALLPKIEIDDEKIEKEIIPEGKVIIANKTGDLLKTQSDVGIFILPNNTKYILSVCFNDLINPNLGIQKIGEISKVVYEEVLKN